MMMDDISGAAANPTTPVRAPPGASSSGRARLASTRSPTGATPGAKLPLTEGENDAVGEAIKELIAGKKQPLNHCRTDMPVGNDSVARLIAENGREMRRIIDANADLKTEVLASRGRDADTIILVKPRVAASGALGTDARRRVANSESARRARAPPRARLQFADR